MGLQLAIGENGDISLWCEDRGFTPEGGQKFWVINGHWAGLYYRGRVYIGYDGDDSEPCAPRGRHYPGKLLWRGRSPFRHNDYNEAMAWLRTHLKRQPELETFFGRMEYRMATKEKIKFGDAVKDIDTERHNERVSALATAHAEISNMITKSEKHLIAMREYQAELVEKGEAVEHLTDEEYANLFNRHFGYIK